jgi:hypothetical protein
MHTKDEIRRRRLEELCQREGGVKAVAGKVKAASPESDEKPISWQSLDQILKGVLLPPKADGTRTPRSLGDSTARQIEKAFDLGEGWFDWPFENVDFKRWSALSPLQRAYFEGQMGIVLGQAEKVSFAGVPAEANGKAVSNKTVEKHYKAPPKVTRGENKSEQRTEDAPQARKKASVRED